jgi:hypothetical protein
MLTEVLTIGFAIVANSNHQAGGDCFANRATGDTWHVGNEWFCGVVPSGAEITVNSVVAHPAPAVVSLVPVEMTETENNTVSTVETTQGNPGNTKSVGNAGENPNGKNTMPLDNAGGNGNGEHGNQGVNH